MIGFGAPLWLLLLGLLPVLRWLHRFQRQGRMHYTAALFLWRRLQPSHGVAGDTATHPDPRWWLRALISLSLILALAEPYRQAANGPDLIVWLDDSLSQFTQEQGRSRLQQGITGLIARIEQIRPNRVDIRSLGNTTASLKVRPGQESDWRERLKNWTTQPRDEPHPPPASLLRTDAHHILLTDGADARLNQWSANLPDIEIIQHGTLKENPALTRLSLRNSLVDTTETSGLIELVNSGNEEIKARLSLLQEGNEIFQQAITLPAGSPIQYPFRLVLNPQMDLTARLIATPDPLPLDNRLQLPLKAEMQSVAVALIGPCDSHLQAFLSAQPRLQPASQAPVITIDCSDSPSITTTPTLRLPSISGNRRTDTSGHWHIEDLQTLTLPTGLRFEPSPIHKEAGTRTLYSAGQDALITETQADRHRIDLHFDLHDPALANSPTYPLLLNALLQRLLPIDLSDSIQSIDRDIEASRITPLLPISTEPPALPATAVSQTSLAEPLILLSLVFMGVELILEFSLYRDRRP